MDLAKTVFYCPSRGCLVRTLGYNIQDNPLAAAAWTRGHTGLVRPGRASLPQSSDADNNIVTSSQDSYLDIYSAWTSTGVAKSMTVTAEK